ncbi:ABC transporter ATP-binding protein [Bacillus carboniphilus]|uniref:ABC transporter ATP-binding protein n=1 Tax=Bacillus carboniphilus TaxID=86663 RepID=A0ABY9JUH9_9BACI|nr:ABC transporter ATP-binding protein [Bacillus carboniphilus]WLR43061.1 ABC transporter ATP-binding protein [Bacillus carboniphilus]
MKNIKINNWQYTFSKLWRYLSKQKVLLFLVTLLVFVSSGLSLLGPYLLGFTIDQFLLYNKGDESYYLIFFLISIYIAQSIFLFSQNYLMIGIAQNTVTAIRNDFFNHIQGLPLRFFQQTKQGDLMSRLTNDIENISRTLNSAFIQVLTSVVTIIGTFILMIWLSPLLTLITLTIVPVMYFGMRWITNRTKRFFKLQQRDLGEMNALIEEIFSGQEIIKSFSKENDMIEEFNQKNLALKYSSYWAQTYTGFIPKLMNMLNNVGFALIIGVGALFAFNNYAGVTVGIIVTFTTYARQFTRPLNDLANQFNLLLSAFAGAERVFVIMEENHENIDSENSTDLPPIKGHVLFDHATFSYTADEVVLKDINLAVSPGQKVAIVGPTGAGKTTLTNLLSKFYPLENGHIYIDGMNLNEVNQASIRKQIGYVLQDTFLFQSTIMENIRYGRLNASDEEVIEAAIKARADDFIKKLPERYQTMLDARGTNISFGQRQLISIARTILSEPNLLVLDEATSNIDTLTEKKIKAGLDYLMYNKTSFIIAHRLNTVKDADLIIVLKEGKIIEKGTHDQLLAQGGYYASMYKTQTINEVLTS